MPNTNCNSRRILVADDDPVIVRVMAHILTDSGYTAVVTHDGRETYRLLQGDADFRAAFFDMQMPHLQGIDLVRHMKTEKRLMRIPVILMTADQRLSLHGESFTAGAMALLMKPVTINNVQTILRLLCKSELVAA